MQLRPNRSAWRRASSCVSEHNCVEFSNSGSTVGVRDSVIPDVALTFAAADWRSFLGAVKDGSLDGHHGLMGTGGRPFLDGA
ncbi:DUF397 domain-containing protein [Dactylosporangium sp. CS-047395]|uniref:DUF397 domain-containing protein n=1 Tax=Dactylosporangium sp. CS-047395 TaxID=3239936 RepID=UPI003D8C17CA